MRLSELRKGAIATVSDVENVGVTDPIAQRLRELGFVHGEPVRIVAFGPVKRDPIVVQVGFTRFAIRQAEAARISVDASAALR